MMSPKNGATIKASLPHLGFDDSVVRSIFLDSHLRSPLIKDKVAYLTGRCRMLKQIALSTIFRISYTFLPVRTFILITHNKRGIRSFSV